MPEQHLDHANVGALFEQVRREAVAQRMRRDALTMPAACRGDLHGAVELACRHGVDRVPAGKEPGRRPRRSPPVTQQCEKLRREHHIPLSLSLAALDPKRHAPAVDVGHLQVRDFGDPQAPAVGDAERGLVLQARRGFDETRHLVLAQHDRQPLAAAAPAPDAGRVGLSNVILKKNRSAVQV